MQDAEVGLFQKYVVQRVDGRDAPGGDKEDARYFVLDYAHDRLAQTALRTYAGAAWWAGLHSLAEDLWAALREQGVQLKTIPEERAESEEIVMEVRARLTELYGPDEANWPKFASGGR